jgi:hypothetical protein
MEALHSVSQVPVKGALNTHSALDGRQHGVLDQRRGPQIDFAVHVDDDRVLQVFSDPRVVGLFVVASLVDEVKIQRNGNGKGVSITMTKKLPLQQFP